MLWKTSADTKLFRRPRSRQSTVYSCNRLLLDLDLVTILAWPGLDTIFLDMALLDLGDILQWCQVMLITCLDTIRPLAIHLLLDTIFLDMLILQLWDIIPWQLMLMALLWPDTDISPKRELPRFLDL